MIKIIGTSHIARESVNQIKDEIKKIKPEIVAVELDINRLSNLFSKKRKVSIRDIKHLGLIGFIFNVVGGFMQRQLGERVGLAPGADMRAAVIEAKKVGAKIALIDQPIQITLTRLSKKMPVREKLKFVSYLLAAILFPWIPTSKSTKIDLSKVPESELIEHLSIELKKNFPSVYQVLVEERNQYLANQLIKIKKDFPDAKIIAVVGAGHLSGINQILKKKGFFNGKE